MNRNLLLPAVAGAVCLALGYVVGGMRGSSEGGAVKSVGASERPSRSGARERDSRSAAGDDLLGVLLKGRSPRELSPEEVGKLIVQLSKQDPGLTPLAWSRRNYQFQLLVEKLSAAQLEDAMAAMMQDGEGKRNGGMYAVLGAFTAKDADRALAWAEGRESGAWLVGSVIGAMAKDDPMRAANLFREGLLNGKFGQMDSWQASSGVAAAMAKLGKASLLQFIDSLPQLQQQQGQLLTNAARSLPEGDRMSVLEEIHKRSKDGRMEEWAFTNCFSQMLYMDPAPARAWLEKMEPGPQRTKLELMMSRSASQSGDDASAKDWAAKAITGSPGKEKEVFKRALSEMGSYGTGQISMLASLLPANVKLTADDFENVASNLPYHGYGGLAAIAATLPDPAERAKLVCKSLDSLTQQVTQSGGRRGMNENDFQLIERQILKIGLTGEHATQVQQSLLAARNAKAKPAGPPPAEE